jgi:RND family efflux transporter MFP subunit
MTKSMTIQRFMLAAAGLAMAGCGNSEPKQTAAAQIAAPVQVRTVEASRIGWPSTYEAVGTVRARTTAQVGAKVMSYVREVRVDAGDRVAANQLLIVLDARDLDAGFQRAEAALTEARSGIPEADSGIVAAKASLELAQVTFGRMKDLFEKKSISNQEFDEAHSKLRLAQANYQVAVARREQLNARIQQAEQGRRAAEVTRGYSEIRAPFAGVVTEKRVNPGDIASPGTALVVIEQAGAYQLEVPVEEARLGAMRIGQAASVKLDAFDQTIPARVSEIVPAVDPGSRSFTAKLALPADSRLRSGLFGRARFVTGEREAVVVPVQAVAESGQVRTVLVAENGVARARLVSLGEQRGDLVEVLSGVSAGDKVVAPRPANLLDGMRVEVRP